MIVPDWLAQARQAEVLFDQHQDDQAVVLAESALQLNSQCALAHQVLGFVLSRQLRFAEAMERLEMALALQPDLVTAHNELGLCHTQLGNVDEALIHFDTALCVQPDHPLAHFNRALAWLKRGKFREGWVEYEWRWKTGLVARPEVPRPRWDGAPLQGRGIFIHTEQGSGDVFQFVRFLSMVKERNGRIVFACPTYLSPILQGLEEVDEWFPIDVPGNIHFDVQVPLLSLPAALGIVENTIPRTVPYLSADPQRVRRWGAHLQGLSGFKVGLCWQGSPTHRGDRLRSLPLSLFAPLGRVPSVHLISLQKGAGEEQITPNLNWGPLTVLEGRDEDGGFSDTAAILQHLDLVITCDTSVAHLAGALGRPVWVLLPIGSDWRWLEHRSDSPWYPTMRLFRQRLFRDWVSVLKEVEEALRQEVVRSIPSVRS